MRISPVLCSRSVSVRFAGPPNTEATLVPPETEASTASVGGFAAGAEEFTGAFAAPTTSTGIRFV
jgi:hypothetical protein